VSRRLVDVLVVSPGVTMGLRASAEELADSLRALGCTVRVLFLWKDTSWATPGWLPNAAGELFVSAALRWKTSRVLRETEVTAFIYGTSIATILQPRRRLARAAVRIDKPASVNRPGIRNLPQRWLERRQLSRACMLLPFSRVGADDLRAYYRVPVIPLPPLVRPGKPIEPRVRRAVCYAANPEKKGLDLIVKGFAAAREDDVELLVAGVDEQKGRDFLLRHRIQVPAWVRWCGPLESEAYRRLVASSTVFISAARREEYGVALLEALADGALLVAMPTAWPIEPIELARALDPLLAPKARSVEALSASIRAALCYSETERAAYALRAGELLKPYSAASRQTRLRDEILPTLLGTRPQALRAA